MPELSEECADVLSGHRLSAVWRPLLTVIGSARAVSFPIHLQLRSFP